MDTIKLRINGITFVLSIHAIGQRMKERGITLEEVERTLMFGKWVPEKNKKYLITFDKFIVVVGEDIPHKRYFAVTVHYTAEYRQRAWDYMKKYSFIKDEYEALRTLRAIEYWVEKGQYEYEESLKQKSKSCS